MKKTTDYITALIIARITGSITPQEEVLLNNLLEKFPEVRALSDFLNETPPPVNIPDRDILEQEAMNIIRMAESRNQMTSASHVRLKRRRYVRPTTIAACMVAIIAVGVIARYLIQQRPQNVHTGRKDAVSVSLLIGGDTVPLSGEKLTIDPDKGLLIDDAYLLRTLKNINKDLTATLAVPAGKRYALELSDGSKASVNSATELKFPLRFKERERAVNVNGEAYFTVKANASRPFIVQLPNSKAIAMGTEFNVNSYNEQQPRIALVSGNVQVTNGHSTALLKPGEVATGFDRQLKVGPMDKDETSWLNDEIYIHDASEKEIVKLTWIYWQKKLTIDKPLENNMISLIIDRRKPIDSFLVQLAPLDKIHPDGDGYRIER
ncbi:FecR family protein [Chitinophaga filiformis]|uniref:FecR domain-containing protein n=1 Tax=Chitinophaga filiformis TaxID=104663 RepID=A0ABY4I6U7_CHIFI|nr:FecR domain-containing protein [Chitinophaga filiformis]UPK71812.1 FecR domain-containing protein [Chitinophaga filiformis]